VPLEERWFRVLADDASPPEQWLEAARNLTQPSNVTVVRGSMAFGGSVTTGPAAGPPGLRGELLRARRGPSVTELMARRIDVLAGRTKGSGDDPPATAACEMAALLGAWDARGGLAAITRQAQRALASSAAAAGDRSHGRGLAARCVAALTTIRIQAGDGAALGEYAKWIVGFKPEDLDWYPEETLAPLWQNAGRPAAERAGEALFGDRRSPWANLLARNWPYRLLGTPLVRLGAFRRLVLAGLRDHDRAGTLEVREGGQYQASFEQGAGYGSGVDPKDPHPPAPGTRHDLRVADYLAVHLRQAGVPPYQPYWPLAERDKAIDAIATYLKALP
jgi:hypothetical protein